MGGLGVVLGDLGAILGGLGAVFGRSWAVLGGLRALLSPLPLPAASEDYAPSCTHPYIFTLVNHALAWGNAAAHRDLLSLKRPMGDINARGRGEYLYWEPLGAILGRLRATLGWFWATLGAL